jgi:hypothetical protein
MKVWFCPTCESTDITITSEPLPPPEQRISIDDAPEVYDAYPTIGGWSTTSSTIETQPHRYMAKCNNCGYAVGWKHDINTAIYVRCVT